MMLRTILQATALLVLVTAASSRSQDANPTAPPKCSAVPAKSFPASPSVAAVKQGRFAACLPSKDCKDTEDKTKAALGASFCAMNQYAACRAGTCDKPTLACLPEFRPKDSKGIKLSTCVSRPSRIACPKEGEEICLCDVEVEAKGSITCGCSCQIAPTPTPTAR